MQQLTSNVNAQVLVGTTFNGGPNDQGAIVQYNNTGSTLTAIARFDGINGANPGASLVRASNGNYMV